MSKKKIVLIACAAGKGPSAAPAGELYQSQLFSLTKKFAERHGDQWFILSARFGLLAPDCIISPYDESLNDKNNMQRYIWAENVAAQFDRLQLAECDITMLAGKNYRNDLQPMLESRGHRVTVPMEGLGIGKQLQFMTQQVKA